MIEAVLSLTLSCSDAQWIIDGMVQSESITAAERKDLIKVILETTDPDCDIKIDGESTSRRNGPWQNTNPFWRIKL